MVVEVRESLPMPASRVRAVPLLLTVTESSPARVLIVSKFEIAVPSTVPAAEAFTTRLLAEALVLRVSDPAPAFRVLREAPAAIVAVSAPAPRVTFSRFEKLIEPRLPLFAPETVRVSAVVVEVRESLPIPVLRVRPVALLLTVTASSPESALIVPTAPALSVIESLPAPMFRVPVLEAMVAVSTPSSILIVSKLEKLAASSVPALAPVIFRVLLMLPV